MEKDDLQKYLGHLVFLTLKSGFQYKFKIEDKDIKEDSISIIDKYGNPVDFNISTIEFITISKDDGGNHG